MTDTSITTTELSAELGIPARTLRRWARAGRISSTRGLGGQYRFNLHWVLRDIELAQVLEGPSAQGNA